MKKQASGTKYPTVPASDPFAGQRIVGHRRQTFPAEVVDDTQDAEATSVDQ